MNCDCIPKNKRCFEKDPDLLAIYFITIGTILNPILNTRWMFKMQLIFFRRTINILYCNVLVIFINTLLSLSCSSSEAFLKREIILQRVSALIFQG
jgi:hypothetical protein